MSSKKKDKKRDDKTDKNTYIEKKYNEYLDKVVNVVAGVLYNDYHVEKTN